MSSETADDQPKWLNPAERRAWVALAGVVIKLPGLLDTRVSRDSGLSFFEYMVLVALSESPTRSLRMSMLALLTSGSLSRLSHVVKRLEKEGYVVRVTDPEDRRATNAFLTDAGFDKVVQAAPGHVEMVREYVIDVLTDEQIEQLGEIGAAILEVIDPEGLVRPIEP